MSIDTVRLSAETYLPNTSWAENEIRQTDMQTGEVVRRLITRGQGEAGETLPRLTYFPEGGRLMAEVSLPKFTRGENFSLLSDEDTTRALHRLIEWTAEKVAAHLPGLDDWNVSRLDACYAWPVGDDMQAYLKVLSQIPVAAYTRVTYTGGNNAAQGFTWIAKTRRVNAYDKGEESAKDEAAGLLRLEVQALNSTACKSIHKRLKLKRQSADVLIRAEVGRAEVSHWLKRIGMPEVIKSDAAILTDMIKAFGWEGAGPRHMFVTAYREMGHSVRQLCSERTYERYLSESKKRGWLVASQGRQLSGLVITKPPKDAKGDVDNNRFAPLSITGGKPAISGGTASAEPLDCKPQNGRKANPRRGPRTTKKGPP